MSLLTCNLLLFSQNPVTNNSDWTVSNLTLDNQLENPYTILNGPDGELWITERVGKKVVRVNKTTGAINTLLNLSSENPPVHQSKGQDGLMGMAIHPDLYNDISTTTNNYVYLAYTYDIDPTDDNDDNSEDDVDRRLRIVRYTYNYNNGNNPNIDINSDFVIIDNLDASNDHNSGKLIMGPDLKLYYAIGDLGANQFINACKPIRSQDLPTTSGTINDYKEYYKGKMLRFNLDGSIPNDNPLFNSVQSHIYSYGHRNAQGIVFGSNGKLYSSEHGAEVDDELNIVEAGKNYGWPEIAGGYDNAAYEYFNESQTSSCGGPGNVVSMKEFDSYPSGTPADFVAPIGTYGSTTTTVQTGNWLTWPTVAPSGIAIYENGIIPNWGTSLLIPTLKRGTIYRVKLDASGDFIEGNPNLSNNSVYEEWHSSNDRYRDVIPDPDGVTFWAITDNGGGTSGPSGTTNVGVTNEGVVMKIQFVGQTLSSESFNTYNFRLYPNPAKTQFQLQFNNNTLESINLSITDIQGRTVKTLSKLRSNVAVSTEDMSNGIYFIDIRDRKGKILNTKKLLVN